MSERFGIVEPVGILLAVQGIGGTINNLGDGGPSWFLLNHIDAVAAYRLPLHIAMAVLGCLLVLAPQLRKWRQDRHRADEQSAARS